MFQHESIKITGIDEAGVTEPQSGDNIYTVAFQLGGYPSDRWHSIFESECRKQGINAYANNNKILLHKTSIEQVRDSHLQILKGCVQIANDAEARELELKRVRDEERRKKIAEHRKHVKKVVNDMSFD